MFLGLNLQDKAKKIRRKIVPKLPSYTPDFTSTNLGQSPSCPWLDIRQIRNTSSPNRMRTRNPPTVHAVQKS